jgi:hypothetical protein
VTIVVLVDLPLRIVCTIIIRSGRKDIAVGQLIMLGTLFGLIVLIFGLVMYFDPEARGGVREERDR